MPSYRIRLHTADGRWNTMFVGANSLTSAVEMAANAIEADDPEAWIIDEVHIKQVTPWRNRLG